MSASAGRAVPRVLVFAGLDPTGGAGLQADIEALSSMGCHSCPIMTANTVQDTRNAVRFAPCAPDILRDQIDLLLADFRPDAIKIGMLGDAETTGIVEQTLRSLANIPIVLDPVLTAGGGTPLSASEIPTQIRSLLPHLALITPNQNEAQRLTGQAAADDQAKVLCDQGCDHVLITGGDAATQQVVNRLYNADGLLNEYSWERVPGQFHGTGCTLTSATTGLLAQGEPMASAVLDAQRYTWESLKAAYAIGRGQHIPNRLFWAEGGDD